jgi:hypothetical protein
MSVIALSFSRLTGLLAAGHSLLFKTYCAGSVVMFVLVFFVMMCFPWAQSCTNDYCVNVSTHRMLNICRDQ